MTVKRIAIVGAGVAGPTLAAQLLEHGQEGEFSIDIFERGAADQDQGCGYDLNDNSREALKKAGVFDRYMEMTRPQSNFMNFYMIGATEPMLSFTQPKLLHRIWGPKLETNRSKMRDILLESVRDKISVHYNTLVMGIRKSGTDCAQLLGEHEKVLGEYELVVDASGMSSPLRKYRVAEDEEDKRAWYTGETWIHGVWLDPEESIASSLVDKMGQGTATVHGRKGQFFTIQRYGAALEDRRASFYFRISGEGVREDPKFVSKQIGLPPVSKFFEDEASKARINEFIKSEMDELWSEEYRDALDSLDKITVRPFFMHPANPNFIEDDLPLICIGDALHALPPWTGMGGNLAMHDTLDLYALITGDEGITIRGLRDLEQGMCKRAAAQVKEAEERKKFFTEFEQFTQGKDEEKIRDTTINELLSDSVNPYLLSAGLKIYHATLAVSSFLEPILPKSVTSY